MILIRRSGQLTWHTPTTTAYADEKSLQALIAQSPSLLPGSGTTMMAVVRELAVPSIGYVDVVGVDREGTITLVECKLKANPEIRRQVVGQVLAYAAGLWGLSYETFDQVFAAAKGIPLAEQVGTLSPDEWNEEQFRASVTDNLAKGRFRLVIVVDSLTDELKQIVLYLNEHTTADMQILALELGYIADEGVEILVPQTYGEESTPQKTQQHMWDEVQLFARLEAICTSTGLAATRTLYERLKARKAILSWSNTPYAGVNFRFSVGGKLISVLSMSEWPIGRGVVAFNFEYLRGLVPTTALQHAADRLRILDGVAALYNSLLDKDYRQRPNLPVDTILNQPNAPKIIEQALDEILGTSIASSAPVSVQG